MPNMTEMVGGSIGCAGIASFTEVSASVSATVALVIPAMVTMSPATASSIGCWDRPRNARILVQRKFSIFLPSRDSACRESPVFRVPASTRPVRIRPMNGSADSVVASMRNGSSFAASCFGGSTCFTTSSNSAVRSLRGPSSSVSHQPERPDA